MYTLFTCLNPAFVAKYTKIKYHDKWFQNDDKKSGPVIKMFKITKTVLIKE